MTNKMKKRLAIIGSIIIVIIIFLLILKGCSKKEYTITFDTNGGNNIANVLVNKNETLVKPEDPVREGYEFVGWYYNDELFDFNSKITGDLVLEARWKEVVKELTGISLNATELTLKPNDTASLEVLFAPSDLTSEVEWESSDEKIATVKDGKITALKEGEATITVTTKDGKFKADCKVIITKKVQEVTSVSISGKKEVYVGETIKLTANVKPKDATNKEVSWTSSNTKVATVDSKGNVKGIKKGTVKITVMTVEGEKKATITITVKEKKEETTPSTPSTPTIPSTTPSTPSKPEETSKDTTISVSRISAKIDKNKIYVGEKAKITYTIEPTNATNKEVEFSANKSGIVIIDKNGNVTGLASGSVVITIITKDGSKKATVNLTIEKIPVNDVKISGAKEVYVGESIKLTADIMPTNATDKTLKWESSNNNIATVKDGTVTGKSHGTVKIKATASNGKTYEYEITVVEYIITLTKLVQPGGSVVQYEITSVVANGTNQNSALFTYNGITYALADERIDSSDVDEKVTTATLKFNGKDVKAKVKYLSRNI